MIGPLMYGKGLLAMLCLRFHLITVWEEVAIRKGRRWQAGDSGRVWNSDGKHKEVTDSLLTVSEEVTDSLLTVSEKESLFKCKQFEPVDDIRLPNVTFWVKVVLRRICYGWLRFCNLIWGHHYCRVLTDSFSFRKQMSFSLKWTKHNCQMSSQASVKLKQNSPIMLINLSEVFILFHCLNPEKRRLVCLKEYYSTEPLYP